MISIRFLQTHIFEAELTDPELGALAVLRRVRGEVPGVDLDPTNLDPINVFNLKKYDKNNSN